MTTHERVLGNLLDYASDTLGFRPSAANREKLEIKLDDHRLLPRWPDLESFHADLLAGSEEAKEILVKAVTVNHTFFFREKVQLEALVAAARGAVDPVIWSAAGSSGEEAYSIAILLLEAGVRRFRIVASDINGKVLEEAHRGVYPCQRLSCLPDHLRLKYFLREGEVAWRVRPELRNLVALKRINLLDGPYFRKPFDFIVCRNVFIYFDERTRGKVLAGLIANLAPKGVLVLGLTEGLLELPAGLERMPLSMYRRLSWA